MPGGCETARRLSLITVPDTSPLPAASASATSVIWSHACGAYGLSSPRGTAAENSLYAGESNSGARSMFQTPSATSGPTPSMNFALIAKVGPRIAPL